VTPGQHLPPDYSLGDESTVGGYAAVHARPAALEGRDGLSYSLDVLTDNTDDLSRPFGAYLLFVQWSRMGAQKVDGHLESGFVAWGETADAADRALRGMTLVEVQRILDTLIRDRDGDSSRRWWDVMRDETGDDAGDDA
jgi:hypothetical protein